MNLRLINTALMSVLVAICGAIVLVLLYLFLTGPSRLPSMPVMFWASAASLKAIEQPLTDIRVKGYFGGRVFWASYSFDCKENKISFKNSGDTPGKIELPGECPKDYKELISALEKLLKKAKRLKLDSLYRELDVWIAHLKRG